MSELPLGGNWSAAVRVGDTVRRRAGVWTPAVHALLAHLRHVGFDAAPEPLGMDEQGRAVMSFLAGEAQPGWPDPMPPWMYEDPSTLVGAARLLRRYHDAVATFVAPPDARWRFVAPGADQLICHNDWAPYNALFAGHVPTAMLDWDSAGPGPRLWDVAWSAYAWVPLNTRGLAPNAVPLPTRALRLASFCEAYGGLRPRDVVAALIEVLPFLAEVIEREAAAGDPGSMRLAGWDAPAHAREDAQIVREQAERLLSAP